MKHKRPSKAKRQPFLYYKTMDEIEAYPKKPVELKLQWLEAQMEFFHNARQKKNRIWGQAAVIRY
jgi:hypothetical protein